METSRLTLCSLPAQQPDQAEGLPPGVFDCKSPDQMEHQHEHQTVPGFFDFDLEDSRTHQLRESITEGGADDICDSSSKSISGYMDIKGSKYDESGDKVCIH